MHTYFCLHSINNAWHCIDRYPGWPHFMPSLPWEFHQLSMGIRASECPTQHIQLAECCKIAASLNRLTKVSMQPQQASNCSER
jgi:hypothetical protein